MPVALNGLGTLDAILVAAYRTLPHFGTSILFWRVLDGRDIVYTIIYGVRNQYRHALSILLESDWE
jgi:hypothetical protein